MEAPLCLTYHFSKKKPRRNIPPDYSLLPIDRGGGLNSSPEREKERQGKREIRGVCQFGQENFDRWKIV